MLDAWHDGGRKFQAVRELRKANFRNNNNHFNLWHHWNNLRLRGQSSDVGSYRCSADIKRAMTIYASWRSTPQQLRCSFCALLSQYTSKLFLALIATVSVLTSLVYQANKQTNSVLQKRFCNWRAFKKNPNQTWRSMKLIKGVCLGQKHAEIGEFFLLLF